MSTLLYILAEIVTTRDIVYGTAEGFFQLLSSAISARAHIFNTDLKRTLPEIMRS
jgi:hypothetical protein